MEARHQVIVRWVRVDADSIIRDCTANNVIYRVFATDAWSRTCFVYLFIRFLDVIWLALFSVVWSGLLLCGSYLLMMLV